MSSGVDAVMAVVGTTQMFTASPRRAYTSRAFCNALSASTACTLPECSNGAPPGRLNEYLPQRPLTVGRCTRRSVGPTRSPFASARPVVSHGHERVMRSGRFGRGRRRVLGGVRRRGQSHPLALAVGLVARRQTALD